MRTIVPDASVILKWVLVKDEPDQEQAFGLLSAWLDGRIQILLPSLWAFEVANVLGIKSPNTAGQIMEGLLAYEFEECPVDATLCREAFVMMKTCGTSFYDSIYHAVAIQKDGYFVTSDKVYFKKEKQKNHVRMMENWDVD